MFGNSAHALNDHRYLLNRRGSAQGLTDYLADAQQNVLHMLANLITPCDLSRLVSYAFSNGTPPPAGHCSRCCAHPIRSHRSFLQFLQFLQFLRSSDLCARPVVGLHPRLPRPSALLTCSFGFNRGIQSQQAGLIRNTANDRKNGCDVLRSLLKSRHFLCHRV